MSITTLEQTIKTDLMAGESWLKAEATEAGLWVWNMTKTSLIAVGPATATVVKNFLTAFIQPAHAGQNVEDVATAALNTAKGAELTALEAIGSTALKQLILGVIGSL